MKRLSVILGLVLIVLSTEANKTFSQSPLLGAEQSRELQFLVDLDTLFLLQDATANGQKKAAELQKLLLRDMGERFKQGDILDPNTIATHVAGYVLSGGDPTTAATLMKYEGIQPSNHQLLEGVSLFMRGDRDRAEKLLKDIDIRALPLRVAGRVALSRAALEKNPAIRQHLLSVAVSMMPGTLVEESALRRSAISYAETGQQEDLWRRLERYQRRFPDSLYAESFWDDLVLVLAKWHMKGITLNFLRLDLIMQEIDVPRRRDLYLHLARQSSRANNTAVADYAAGRTLGLADEGSADQQTAKLYLALYTLGSEPEDMMLEELTSIRRDMLTLEDKGLLDAGLWIAQQISKTPIVNPDGESVETPEKAPLQIRLEKLLVEVDKLLVESNS